MRGLSRQAFLRRSALTGAALAGGAAVAACGGPSIAPQGNKSAAACGPGDNGTPGKLASELRFSNWTAYIDVNEDNGSHPSLDAFTKQTGVKVRYVEDINDNESFNGKNEPILSSGQGIDRDIVVLTDWMASNWVRLGYVQETNLATIPNIANLQPTLTNPRWDPLRRHSLPWQSGMTGIAYDPERVGKEITKVDDLLDPKLKGKIALLTELPDTMGLLLLSLGLDPSKVDDTMFDKAMQKLNELKPNVRNFTGNDYTKGLATGDLFACFAWSGDVVQLRADNPNLKFVVPEQGGMIWTDNMLVPTGGDLFTANTYMNYVYDPKVAATVEAYVNYICPVVGAREALLADDPDTANNELIFPPEATLNRLHAFDTVAANNADYRRMFNDAIGA